MANLDQMFKKCEKGSFWHVNCPLCASNDLQIDEIESTRNQDTGSLSVTMTAFCGEGHEVLIQLQSAINDEGSFDTIVIAHEVLTLRIEDQDAHLQEIATAFLLTTHLRAD